MEPFDLNCLFQSLKVGILGSFTTELRRRDIEVVEGEEGRSGAYLRCCQAQLL